jgi:acetyl esterase/lipase
LRQYSQLPTSLDETCRIDSQALSNKPRYTNASTDSNYAAFCKTIGQVPDSEILTDGTRAHWIGPRKCSKLIIHFHGGGYVLPAQPYIYSYIHHLASALSTPTTRVSALILSYDLAPGAIYPRQLAQAVLLLKHVLENLDFVPSDIILTGDSAGGNLACALLLHLAHPHPSASVPRLSLKDGEKLLAAVLISPWVSFDLSHPSYANYPKDLIDAEMLKCWSEAFMGTEYPFGNTDAYNQPAIASASLWEGVPVEAVLVTGGDDEVLRDGILELARRIKEGLGEGRVQVLVAKNEAHEAALLDLLLQYQESTESGRAIEGFVRAKL